MGGLKKSLHSVNLEHLYYFSVSLIGIRLLTRCLQSWSKVPWPDFRYVHLWAGLGITLLCHLLLLTLAWVYSKIFIKLSALILYAGFLLSFYFIFLINSLLWQLPETLIMRLILAGLIGFPLFQWFRSNHTLRPRFSLSQRPAWIPGILIALWLIHSGLFFLEGNLRTDRTPFVDETSFWYVAAETMIITDTLQALRSDYSSKSSHPYGIPFIAALPAIITDFQDPSSVFFMPWVVILILMVFLFSIQDKRWSFLFFLTALFVTFNDRGWLSELLYVRIYGEGLSTIFFLGISFELTRWAKRDHIPLRDFFVLCFIIGLLTLTKFPLAAVWPVFLIPILIIGKKTRPWKKYLPVGFAGIWLAFIPLMTWLIFNHHLQLTNPSHHLGWENIPARLLSANWNMLSRVFHHLLAAAPHWVYFTVISILFCLALGSKKNFLSFTPALFHILVILGYYGYVYQYGRAGGDHASALRYLMPMTLALFWAGATAFDNIMNWIKENAWPQKLKILAGLILIGLFLPKLF